MVTHKFYAQIICGSTKNGDKYLLLQKLVLKLQNKYTK